MPASTAPPTRLSAHVNEGWFWLHWADQDYVAARILYLAKNPQLWMPAALIAHKALEEYLKALLRSCGNKTNWKHEGRKGHDLVCLAEKCITYDSSFGNVNLRTWLRTFFDYYLTWEYPDASGTSQPLGSDDLELLDQTVAYVRPRIRFEVFYPNLPHMPKTLKGFLSAGLPEQRKLLQWAKKRNNWFDRM